MLELPTIVYFGKNDRFKAYQFDSHRFLKLWIEDGNKPLNNHTDHSVIFVEDTSIIENYGFHPVIFQDWCSNIDHLDQVIAIVRKRYSDAFYDNEPHTIFVSPSR